MLAYMWMTHRWLIYKFLQPVVYGLHDVVANLIVLLLVDFIVAYGFKRVEMYIDKYFHKIKE